MTVECEDCGKELKNEMGLKQHKASCQSGKNLLDEYKNNTEA
jgi:hypothetical protein